MSQDVTFYRWSECDGAAEIHFYQIKNGGHTWPGGAIPEGVGIPGLGQVNQDIDASLLIWELFSRHSTPLK